MSMWLVAAFLFACGGNVPVALLCVLAWVVLSDDEPKAHA